MTKALLKKQILEVFSWLYVDKKSGSKRSHGKIILFSLLYGFLFLYLAGIFFFMSYGICGPLSSMGYGWLYFLIVSLIGIVFGVVGSVEIPDQVVLTLNLALQGGGVDSGFSTALTLGELSTDTLGSSHSAAEALAVGILKSSGLHQLVATHGADLIAEIAHGVHDEDIIIQTYTISIGKAGAEQLQAYVMEFKFIHNWGIFSTNIQLFSDKHC